MKNKAYKIVIDIKKGIKSYDLFRFTSGDYGVCEFEFEIIDKDVAYDLTSAIVRLIIRTPSGASIQQDCTILNASKGTANIVMKQSCIKEQGTHMAEVQIYNSTNQTLRLTLPRLAYTVEKSLLSDDTSMADDNFSILQNMIINVKNADAISKEALKIANNAKAVLDEIVPKANEAASNAQEALNRAESVVTQEELSKKITVNGTSTNVNFKKNEIVQDGLVLNPTTEISDTGNFTLFVDINTATDGTIIDQMGINSESKSSGWKLEYRNGNYVFLYYDTSGLVITTNIPSTKHKHVALIKNGVEFILYTQNHNQTQIKVVNYCVFNKKINYTRVYNCYGYKRNLTSQEIAHNISVLNNPSSVNAIETTDSSSVKTSFLFATDSDHVEMPNGKTLREFAYQTLDWETKKSDGSDISVTNGKEAWVRNAKISGNTAKCIANTDVNYKTITANSVNNWITVNDTGMIKASTNYTIVLEVTKNTLNNGISANTPQTYGMIETQTPVVTTTGVFIYKVKSYADLTGRTHAIRGVVSSSNTTGEIIYRMCLIEGHYDNIGFIPFGLTSTQAIISNNGLKYPFYASAEDKAIGTVITLGGVGGVYDTFEIKEDGTGVYTKNTIEITLNGSETYSLVQVMTDVCRFTTTVNNLKPSTSLISNTFINNQNSTDEEGIATHSSNSLLYVKISKSKLSSTDYTGSFKTWLSSNPITVRYQLATPVITYIPKEPMPVITTEETNSFSVDSAVKPSGLEITVAVDKVADLEKRLQVVEAVINSTSNLSLQANYAEDEYNNLINQL